MGQGAYRVFVPHSTGKESVASPISFFAGETGPALHMFGYTSGQAITLVLFKLSPSVTAPGASLGPPP